MHFFVNGSSYTTLNAIKRNALYVCASTGIALFAFLINWHSGNRGIFFLDQSMIFDGAWRILEGQVPYKDWLIPFGPVTFYIQALFFRIIGVTWSATVLPACIMNVIAALSVMRITRLLLGPDSRLLACGAGFITAVCFQPPFGTIWLEQSSMFFDFLGLLAIATSLHRAGRTRRIWQAAGGVSLAVAYLAKQNFGFFFAPVLLGVLVAAELPDFKSTLRALIAFSSGLAGAVAGFIGWLWSCSDPTEFVHRTLVVASEIGRSRLLPREVVMHVLFGGVPAYAQADAIAKYGGALSLMIGLYNIRKPLWKFLAPVSACALSLAIFQTLVQLTTLNEWQNSVAFTGLAAALGLASVLRVIRNVRVVPRENELRLPSAQTLCLLLGSLTGLWATSFLLFELRAVHYRYVQQFGSNAVFHEMINAPGLDTVRWGEPTYADQGEKVLRKHDFEQLLEHLKQQDRAFFVMGDSTILYALLGKRSPQPLLYFQPNHSFLPNDIPQLDERVTAALVSNDVQIVVREKVKFMKEDGDTYQKFPRLWTWFTTRFQHVAEFGNYEVWERTPI